MQNQELTKDMKALNKINPLYLRGTFMDEYFPTVVQAVPFDNFYVQVFFDDGKIVEYDVANDLQTDLFEPLRDIHVFKEICTVMNDTLAWDISGDRDSVNCIDIDPFTLYELDPINNLIA